MKYLPRVRLYSNKEIDQEIIRWLRSLPADTNKSATIKEILYHGMRISESVQPRPTTSLNLDALRRDFLPDIRRIVDAALQQTLGALSSEALNSHQQEATLQIDGDEIEDILDTLEMSFMLDDDEEEL